MRGSRNSPTQTTLTIVSDGITTKKERDKLPKKTRQSLVSAIGASIDSSFNWKMDAATNLKKYEDQTYIDVYACRTRSA